MARVALPVAMISLIIASFAGASSDGVLIKDAGPCKKAPGLAQLSSAYLSSVDAANAKKTGGNGTAMVPPAVNGPLPPNFQGGPNAPGSTQFQPKFEVRKPGSTVTQNPAPGGPTPAPTTNNPSPQLPNSPLGGLKRPPRPVGCGTH